MHYDQDGVEQGDGGRDLHGGPGWLATSGLSCLIGRHWPAAALTAARAHDRRSQCADCGKAMVRTASGHWQTIAPRPAGTPAMVRAAIRHDRPAPRRSQLGGA